MMLLRFDWSAAKEEIKATCSRRKKWKIEKAGLSESYILWPSALDSSTAIFDEADS